MLKIRVMPTLLFKDVGLVKGVRFSSDRRVGGAMQAIKVYNRRGVDELVFLDVTATLVGRPPDFAHIDQLADECFMPLTVGGGVRNIEDIANLLAVGADKVAINTAAVNDPPLISRGSSRFGAQCIVVAIDVRRHNDDWRVYTHCGTRPTELAPVAWAQQAEKLGAGEILLTSIDRDGTMEGYDVEVTRRVCDAVSVPVIASGGAGEYSHMADVLRNGKASAVAAASIYHFTEKTPREAKMFLQKEGLAIRV
jgi:imidazole glycerol-phosphate synthase subunit HisF